MATRDRREQRQDKNGGEGAPKEPSPKPAWTKRYWTGGGAVEVAVFERAVDSGNSSFTTYSTAARRTYKEGDEYKTTHSFRPEDLLALAHGLTEAFSWISAQDKK